MPLLLAALAAAIPASTAEATAAQQYATVKVVLLRMATAAPAESWPEAEQRARSELEVAGFLVVEEDAVALEAGERRTENEGAAHRHAAAAALRILRVGSSVTAELWFSDHGPGRMRAHLIAVEEIEAADAAALIGLRVVELVNAGLQAVRRARAPAPASGPPPARSLAVRAGVFALGTPGGVGPVGGLAIGGLYGLRRRMALEADAAITVVRSELEGMAGFAPVGFGLARLHAVFHAGAGGPLSFTGGLGVGLLTAWESFEGETAVAWVASACARGGVSARLRGPVRLYLGLGLGMTALKIELFLGDERLASAGQPTFDAVLALEWSKP